MEFDDEMELEESATQSGMKKFGKILAIGTILIVAGFGDVMYIQLMSSHFPSGVLMALCYVGAFTSFLAIAYMLIGKSILFTPGLQMLVAWFIFLAELALIGLNIILVFQSDGANSTGFLAAWLQLAPATPVINMAGVAVLFFLDEEGKMRHEDMELAWDMKRANRRHFKAMARARLRLQNKQLGFLVTELDRAVAAPESLQAIQQTAIDMNAHLLGQLSGGRTYRIPALPAGSTVDSNPPTPPSAPTTPPATPNLEPESEKKPGWFKNPFAREAQPSAQDIAAAMIDLMKQQPAPVAVPAAQQPSYTDDLVASVAPAPTTENLRPLAPAPFVGATNGNHPMKAPE